MKKGIVIIFPGIAYTCEEKLLVECNKKYRAFGYDLINIDFADIGLNLDDSLESNFLKTKDVILNQVRNIDFNEYNDIVFISKSIGTACAAWLEDYFKIDVRQYFLTPIQLCLEYIKNTSNVMAMVIGTNDKFINYKKVESFCTKNKIKYLIFENVGHSLKYKEDPERTEKLNKQIVELLASQ